ncbi:MAG: ribokinase [Candidatus Promineifilaceae bacterium]|jgi:ribokinase
MNSEFNKSSICVVGACNIDLISYVPRMPAIGETLHGSRFRIGFGGKGANQAVMAAKLGANVSVVTKLGRDTFGEDTLKNFNSFNVNTEHVHFTEDAFSGVAPISVNPEGQNSIVIVTGANDLLTEEELEAARPVISQSGAVVCQLEIPIELNLKALSIAREEGVLTIFNPAPAFEGLPAEFYELSDIICPNERETELLTGLPVETDEQAEAAARVLLERGVKTVILTLGERGALIVDQDGSRRIEAERVNAIDSSGAGDAFVGSLATFLTSGIGLDESVKRACSIATMSVQKMGTQTSFPAADEIAYSD